MQMTHSPETGAEIRLQKTDADFWRWFLDCVSSSLQH